MLPFARRRLNPVLAAVALLSVLAGCGGGGDDAAAAREQALAAAGPTADVVLGSDAASATLTGSSVWTLAKTGSLSGNTVTWNISASHTATPAGRLLIQGQMTVANTGSGPATIGNVVVNLQKRVNNKWVGASSNVADATQGDAATTARIHAAASSENKSSFTENSASGSLNFMDATNNTVFALVPQVMIGAGATKALLFSAEFDNNDAQLGLTPGTQIRAEVIVTFGNATRSGNSTANVDINGNGTLDADEGRVRSVPSRLTVTVPAAVNGNGTVTLTDTEDDIEATGDVTFSNVVINLGATSGTVTANVVGGANGGSITNCAYLRSDDQNVGVGGFTFPIVDGVDLQSCSTVEVSGSPTCTPGAPGCGWKTGDMRTFPQGAYGDSSTQGGGLLEANFNSLYGATNLVVGGTQTLRFTSANAVFNYLPASGVPAALTGSLTNPLTSSSGEFGGQTLALQLNVDFSGAGVIAGALDLGSLYICNYAASPAVNGQTVDQFLTTANWLLGGGSASFGVGTATTVATQINNAFVDGAPSTFAQANLQAAPCSN